MPLKTSQSSQRLPEDLTAFAWKPQPQAAELVQALVTEALNDSPYLATLSRQMLEKTGTRLFDWLDHIGLPATHPAVSQLTLVGYQQNPANDMRLWEHPAGLLPRIHVHNGTARQIAIKVESVVDFLATQRLFQRSVLGHPGCAVRKSLIAVNAPTSAAEFGIEVWVVERHGSVALDVPMDEICDLSDLARHAEAFRLRNRFCSTDEAGFDLATQLIDAAIIDLGRDRTCDLFFTAEREYWLRRNRAGQIQKARQDALGLGWANHDHHTYRSSRHCFSRLIAFLERLGFLCRERFYAGHEAGWGAQVIEHPVTGVTIFADVDLSPEEVSDDFAHNPLPRRQQLGTVGLWCALHGEAFLQAGMHHLECQFDFSATRDQLLQVGIETMPPFTDFPYLKQAFTRGDTWPVDPVRIESLRAENLITPAQANHFLQQGAIGSHLEILQRNDGYKGFNQSGINQIITATDPRHATNTTSDRNA